MAARTQKIDYDKLYSTFVRALERKVGPKDPAVIHATIGFEFGGPPDILLFSNPPDVQGIFYVTSDLLFSKFQPKNSLGQYELAMCAPAKSGWARKIISRMTHPTLDSVFDHGHTADITAWVDAGCKIKGLVFTKLTAFKSQGNNYGVLLCTGVTRKELDYALKYGAGELVSKLQAAGVFPLTDLRRRSVV